MQVTSNKKARGRYHPGVVMLTRLRQHRIRANLNQRELATKARMTPATLSRIEAGLQEPYTSTIRKLAKALGVRPDQLMGPLEEDE